MKFINLVYETELLESLDWSEEKLSELYSVLEEKFTSEILCSPELLLQEIKTQFGESTQKVLAKIFKQVLINTNLHLAGDEIEN